MALSKSSRNNAKTASRAAFCAVIASFGAASVFSGDALAQIRPKKTPAKPQGQAASQGQGQVQGWSVRTGGGFLYTPAYLGADEYQSALLPDLNITIGDRFFASVQEGIGYRVINDSQFSAGPIARPAFGRPEDGGNPFRIAGDRSDDLRGLGEINTGLELGGFAKYRFGRGVGGRAGSFRADAEVRQAVGGHEGLVADVRLSYANMTTAFKKPVLFNVGPQATFADGVFMNAFFGVDAGQSAASGLDVYDAPGGRVSYGARASAVALLTPRISSTFLVGYDRIGDNAGDGPLIRERGTRDQFISGVFLSYTFGRPNR